MKTTYEKAKQLADKCEETLDFHNQLGTEFYYSSLVFCVIDAVFSIGAHYSSTERAAANYACYYKQERYRPENTNADHRISDFIHNYELFEDPESFAEKVFRNRQRTSSTNGILKAEACYEVAKILKAHNIETISDFRKMSQETEKQLVTKIKSIKGQGSGLMVDYLFMLAGDENKFKADRHLLSFVSDILEDDSGVADLIESAHQILKEKHPNLTIRHLDYLIWNYQRSADKKNYGG